MASSNLGQVYTNAQNKTNQNLQAYQQSQAYKNNQAMQNATIQDISKKYGFNFTPEYAKTQAEAIAQSERNAYNASVRNNQSQNKLATRRIEDDYRGAASSLDKNYFQQFQGQTQSQTNRGLNAGMAAAQNTQLAMNRQGELADIWRTRNQAAQEEQMRFSNEDMRLQEALALVEQQRIAREQQMYQDLLFKGYDVLSRDRDYGLRWDESEWGRTQDQNQLALALANMDADRLVQEAGLTGMYNGAKTWERQMEEARLAAARAAASRGGGGSRGGSSGGNTSYSAQQIIDAARMRAVREQQAQMSAASPKLNPNATSGLASRPGSYWYARGYGSQYLPK